MDIFALKTLDVRLFRGSNYWSNYRKKIIQIKLDLQSYENYFTDQILGFNKRLIRLIPSLHSHCCSYHEPGGFFKRLEEGTLLGHVVEHVALELQNLAGMDVGFGRTRSANQKGIYHVVYEYEHEEAGLYAGHTAIKLVQTLAKNKNYYGLQKIIQNLIDIHQQEKLGPSTAAIINEAHNRKIPVTPYSRDSVFMLGFGANQRLINTTMTDQTSSIGIEFAGDKSFTKDLLSENRIPVPEGYVITRQSELNATLRALQFPVVIKPLDSNHGNGVTTNIRSIEKAFAAFELASHFSSKVIVEKFIQGLDYRLLMVNFKLVAAAKREAAFVTGDGVHTIKQLIDITNSDPKRGAGHDTLLTKIEIDKVTKNILKGKRLKLNSVLTKGHKLYLKDAANLSSGGTAEDVSDEVHKDNIFLAERIARIINLDICGIDLIARNLHEPIKKSGGVVIEVNAAPGFRMHLQPSQGKGRDVAKGVVDMLFPNRADGRIPLIAVTGTNGKTTVVRLMAHLASSAGYFVGLTCTDGIYINHAEVCRGDCSGPLSAKIVLQDPKVNFAVLECARGGILRSGLGFDYSSISIITNVTSDHLGLDEIHTVDEMARVKEVVARSTMKTGFAILNADDDLVYQMKNNLDCHIALFSTKTNNPRIQQHCEQGGIASYIENDTIMIKKHEQALAIISLNEMRMWQQTKIEFMLQNILPAVLASVLADFPLETIRSSLMKFTPSPKLMPGRMNFFHFDKFTLLVDYAHNEAAFIELKKYLCKVKSRKKVGIIAATGDRRSEDIISVGNQAAQIFDEIIIRHDIDGRGRTNEELTTLLTKGIRDFDPLKRISVISDENEALHYAIAHAKTDSYIFYFPEHILNAVELIGKMHAKQAIRETIS